MDGEISNNVVVTAAQPNCSSIFPLLGLVLLDVNKYTEKAKPIIPRIKEAGESPLWMFN